MNDTPSRRAGLRDELVNALGQITTIPPVAHRREQADNVLAVLYREWPWLRAEAEELAEDTAADDTPVYGCTINGVPAMPILVNEYNQLVTQLAEARAEIARYAEADSADAAAGSYAGRAEQAEAVIARVQALADEYPAGIDTALIHEALDQPGPAATQTTDRATQLTALARDILSTFVPTRDSTGMHITHHQARVLPHEMQAWQDTLDETEQS